MVLKSGPGKGESGPGSWAKSGKEWLRAVLRPYGPEKAVLGRARAALVPGRKAGKSGPMALWS
ncbi:hypothetical protein ATY36_17965 [Vibrio cidicii]|nr:hypothetical protein ATY36_17965 [Vibrio cidicii]